MDNITNYQTHDDVKNNSEIVMQFSNFLIFLFPLISLFFVNNLNPTNKTGITIVLIITMLEGLLSGGFHAHDNPDKTLSGQIFSYLDTIGVIFVGLISLLIIFNIIFSVHPNPLGKNKNMYRTLYIVIGIMMLLSYCSARTMHRFKKKKGELTEDEKHKIYNLYHTMWHLCGALLMIVTILYVFNTNSIVAIRGPQQL